MTLKNIKEKPLATGKVSDYLGSTKSECQEVYLAISGAKTLKSKPTNNSRTFEVSPKLSKFSFSWRFRAWYKAID